MDFTITSWWCIVNMINRGWWHRLVGIGGHSLKIRGKQGHSWWKWSPIQSMHGNLGLGGLMGGFPSDDAFKAMVALLPPCWIVFFFFSFPFPFFFFSATWLLVSLLWPSEEEEGGGETNKEEGEGSTSGSTGGVLDYGEIMTFWTKEVENSHTGRPM